MTVHTKYEVSMTIYVGRRSNRKKNTKIAAIYKLKVRITKYLMCIYGGHMYMCVPNMKFLCLTQCQGKVCTDNDAPNADANTNDTRRTIHDCIRLFGW